MKISYLLLFVFSVFLFSCSSEDPDITLAASLIGEWQLETIRVDGVDCKTNFGSNVPEEYLADEEGCAVALEVLGNSSRCINIDLRADGIGTFLWSEITGGEDAEITYTVENGEFEYCFEGSSCSSGYSLVGDKLESKLDVVFDGECSVTYVLKRK